MNDDFICQGNFENDQLSLEIPVSEDESTFENSDLDASSDSELDYEIPENFDSLKDLDLEETYTNFENVDVMTLTLISNLNREIKNLETLFYVLPWIKTEYVKPKRKIEKFKIPWPGVPGIICSLGYEDKKRGIVTTMARAWPHSVCLHISNSTKMVACKISKNTIHMTGCKNIEMGIETSKLVLNHINESFCRIKSMKKLSKKKILELVIDFTSQGIYMKNMRLKFDARRITNIPENLSEDENNFYNLCYAATSDLKNPRQVRRKLEWLVKIKNFSKNILIPKNLDQGLIKLNFNLGFSIDLKALNVVFRKVDSSFLVDYQPMVRAYVKIERKRKNKTKNRKKKDSVEKHSFNIRQKGQVQFSSKNFTEMKEVYNRFIWVIDQIRSVIIITPKSENLSDSE